MARAQLKSLAPYAPSVINVRGKVSYSRITHFIEGEELAKMNQKNIAKGMIARQTPYITITLKEAVVIDDVELHPEVKKFFIERVSTKSDGTPANSFTQDSKSKQLPTIAYGPEAGTALQGVVLADKDHPLQKELAQGMDVTLGIKLFNYNGYTGTGIDYIILNEPVRYYETSPLSNYFEKMGIENKGFQGQPVTSPSSVVTPVQEAAPTVPETQVTGQAVNPMNNQVVQPMNTINVQGQAPAGVPQNVNPTAAPTQQVQPQVTPNATAQQVQAGGNPMVDVNGTFANAQGGANYGPQQTQEQVAQQPTNVAPAGLSYTPQ